MLPDIRNEISGFIISLRTRHLHFPSILFVRLCDKDRLFLINGIYNTKE
jgi:hypothetical protein